MKTIDSLIEQQIGYYKARASEYDEWFLRQGRYDHGTELNKEWFDEIEQIRNILHKYKPVGKILEIACGTGLWTQQLVKYAIAITAIDAVDEVLEYNKKRLHSNNIRYIKANIFNWNPDEKYDFIFFSFWLSHVPLEYFNQFWELVGQSLKSGGRVFFIDSKYEQTSTALNHKLGKQKNEIAKRILNDGRIYQIVKIFYDPEELNRKLSKIGWKVNVNETSKYFIYGNGTLT